MHVVKSHAERKTEFLDTAMRLFMQHGYEQTSVNAIIDAVGVSKGAFYHYFKTKDELLTELSKRASEQALAAAAPVLDDNSLDAVGKLNAVFHTANAFKANNRELMMAIAEVFYSDGNLLLRTRLAAQNIDVTAPVLATIIEAGNREGSMAVRDPQETARLVLRIGVDLVADFARELRAGDPDRSVARIVAKLQMYTEAVERILGIEPGHLTLIDEAVMTLIRDGASAPRRTQ